MALFTEDRLNARLRRQPVAGMTGSIQDSLLTKANVLLSKSLNEQRVFSATATKTYDIFLSHSSDDAKLVAGLKLELEDLGYSVYVDWIEDKQLDRKNVNKQTAQLLQQRMKQCKTLIYAFSENASNSKWMPWELGYFDGIKGKVAVLPISKTSKTSFVGSEYLGIYYYVQVATISGTTKTALWIHESSTKYVQFEPWTSGTQPIQR
jgi:hypothetical protein